MPTPADVEALVAEASLAPSVHNTQPTRWRLEDDGRVLALEDIARRLPVGDPQGRDANVSHGAAIEGFAIAAAERGLTVAVEPSAGESVAGLRPVARLTLAPGGAADPLHPFMGPRRTYRGRFLNADCAPALDALEGIEDLRLVRARPAVEAVARANDAASLLTFRDPVYRAELLSWMRLSPRHPRWAIDGLNAEAMEMSPIEAAGAGLVLRPGVFEGLDRFSLAAPLVAEAAVVRSAAAIALFHRPEGEAPLETGRRFHRVWLEITRAGLSADPMAVLADDPETRAMLSRAHGLAEGRQMITAFRIGLAPERARGAKPRLAPGALIV